MFLLNANLRADGSFQSLMRKTAWDIFFPVGKCGLGYDKEKFYWRATIIFSVFELRVPAGAHWEFKWALRWFFGSNHISICFIFNKR